MKRYHLILIFWISIFSSTNCYYNPLVQKILVTDPNGDNSLFHGLSLLGLVPPPFPLSISGQLRDNTGATESDIQLTVVSRSNNLEGLNESATTDTSGRFFIRLSSGTTQFALTKAGSPYYSFTLLITSPISISVIEMNGNPVGAEVTGLISYDKNNPPVFFELTDSVPKNNETVYNQPSGFYFYFSDDPQGPEEGLDLPWLAQNITVTPSISMLNVSVEGQSLYVMTSGFSSSTTTYTITLGSGILSISGIPLTPRNISFTCQSPCPP